MSAIKTLGALLTLAATALVLSPAWAEAPTRHITVDFAQQGRSRAMFWQACVGADHPGILLRPANLEQLELVHREVGFQYIRFHGILHDDMQAYREENGAPVYDFSRIDAVYDAVLRLRMRPFVEISFMPKDLASETGTIFWWKANGSPPKDYERWGAFIEAWFRHLEQRYGRDELARWRFEIWNEPNLAGFWTRADQNAYFRLYDVTVAAIKKVDPILPVGGPATAGAAWVPDMIAHARSAGVAIDFISTHTYGVQGGFLDEEGQADQKLSPNPDSIIGDLRRVHEQVHASALPELPIHFTEWSTSYSPRDPVHDAYISAAFILEKVKKAEGLVDSLSYWTYTDLFEEAGPPPTPFHGGFGLINREGVRKAAFFAYKYLNALRAIELPNSDSQSWVTRDDRSLAALFWDYSPPLQEQSDKPYYRKLHPASPVAPVALEVKSLPPGRYRLSVYRTGYRANDAYSRYLEWGMPEQLTNAQLAELQALSADKPEQHAVVRVGTGGVLRHPIAMRTNDIVLLTLAPVDASAGVSAKPASRGEH